MVKGSTSVQQEEDYLCCLKGIKVTEILNIGQFAAHVYYGICVKWAYWRYESPCSYRS